MGEGGGVVATLFGAFLANSVKPKAAAELPVAYGIPISKSSQGELLSLIRVSRCDNFSKRTAPAKRPQNR